MDLDTEKRALQIHWHLHRVAKTDTCDMTKEEIIENFVIIRNLYKNFKKTLANAYY